MTRELTQGEMIDFLKGANPHCSLSPSEQTASPSRDGPRASEAATAMSSRDPAFLDVRLLLPSVEFQTECNAHSFLKAAQATVLLTCTWRSNVEQSQDYAKGRDANGNVIDKVAIVTDEMPASR